LARRLALVEEAIELARGTGELRTLAEVLRLSYEPIRVSRTLDLRRGLARELLACAMELGDPALEYWAHNFGYGIGIEEGSFEQARLALEQVFRLAGELDQPIIWWNVAFLRAGW